MQVIRLTAILPAKTNLKPMSAKKTLSKKQRSFNKSNLTTDDEVYVAIDVHKNCHIAIRLNGTLALTFAAPSDNVAIARMLVNLNSVFLDVADAWDPSAMFCTPLRAAWVI